MPMPTFIDILKDYLLATIAYWWLLLPGVLMPLPDIIAFFRSEQKEKIRIPRWVRWTIALACLTVAQFLAYRDTAQNLATVIEDKRRQSIVINALNAKGDALKDQLTGRDIEIAGLRQRVHDLENAPPKIVREFQRPLLGFLQSGDPVALQKYSSVVGGQPLALNLSAINKGSEPVYEAYGHFSILLVGAWQANEPALLEESRKKAAQANQQRLREGKKGTTVGVGYALWATLKTPQLTEESAASLLNGSTRLYVYGWAIWKDSQGRRGTMEQCIWLQKPTSSQLKKEEMAWHICSQ